MTITAYAQDKVLMEFIINGEKICLYNNNGYLSKGTRIDDENIKLIARLSDVNIKPPIDRAFGEVAAQYENKYQIYHNGFLIDGDTMLTSCSVMKLSRDEAKDFLREDDIDPTKVKVKLLFPLVIMPDTKFYQFHFTNAKAYLDHKGGNLIMTKPVKKPEEKYVRYEIIANTKFDSFDEVLSCSMATVGKYYLIECLVLKNNKHQTILFYTDDINKEFKLMVLSVDSKVAMIEHCFIFNAKILIAGNYVSEDRYKRSLGFTELKEYDGFYLAELDASNSTFKNVYTINFQKETWYVDDPPLRGDISYFNKKSNELIITISACISGQEFGGVPFLFRKIKLDPTNFKVSTIGEVKARYTKDKFDPELKEEGKFKLRFLIIDQRLQWLLVKESFVLNNSIKTVQLINALNPMVAINESTDKFIYETGTAYFMVNGWSNPTIECLAVKYKNKADMMHVEASEFSGTTMKNTVRIDQIKPGTYRIKKYGKKDELEVKEVNF